MSNITKLAAAVNAVNEFSDLWIGVSTGYPGSTVHMGRDTFEGEFSEYETRDQNGKNARLFVVIDGVEFFCLAEYATKQEDRAIKPLGGES